MAKATVQIPEDKSHKHKIVIPIEIWNIENLHEGDYIEIDIQKILKTRIRNQDLIKNIKNR